MWPPDRTSCSAAVISAAPTPVPRFPGSDLEMTDLDTTGVGRARVRADAPIPLHHGRPQGHPAAPGHEIGRGPALLDGDVRPVHIAARRRPLRAQLDEDLRRAHPDLHPASVTDQPLRLSVFPAKPTGLGGCKIVSA